MASPALPIGLQSYPADAKPLTAERVVNLYAETAPTTAETPVYLRRTPGLKLFATCSDAPVKAERTWRGLFYAVVGDELYSISSTGVPTRIGGLKGSGSAQITANAIGLVIRHGTEVYTYTGTGVPSRVTDTDLPAVAWIDFLDQYIVAGAADTGTFYWSDLSDARSWDALSFATAEAHPDYTVRGIVDHRELILFGKKRTEIFYNTGDSNNVFARIGSAFIERGCAAAESVAKEDNSVFWLGDDRIVYRMNGRTPVRQSTHGQEAAWEKYADVSDAEGWFHTWNGHKFYCLSFPSENVTWCLDLNTGLWAERQSWDGNIWRVKCGESEGEKIYGRVLVGDRNTGNIYELDDDTHTENGEIHRWILTTPPIHAQRSRVRMSWLEVNFEPGTGLLNGQGSEPLVMLRVSDDGARTWSNRHYRRMGAQGEYDYRTYWTRLGQFRRRSLEFSCTEPIDAKILSVNATLELDEV